MYISKRSNHTWEEVFRAFLPVLILLMVLALMDYLSIRSELHDLREYKAMHDDDVSSYDQAYEEGLADGFAAAREEGITSSGDIVNYYEIYDMTEDEILDYLNSYSFCNYYSSEDIQSLYAYAFQDGYYSHMNGVYDEAVDEFIDGYLFSDQDIEFYSSFRP